METDYYIEISGEGLSDGMEVKTSANDTATAAAGADDAQQSGENAMFSMDMGGGMPGGDMPVAVAARMPSGGREGCDMDAPIIDMHGIVKRFPIGTGEGAGGAARH